MNIPQNMVVSGGPQDGVPATEKRPEPAGNQGAAISRADLYEQHFSVHVRASEPASPFIRQVTGYGVQVFAQASSFSGR